MSGDKFDGVTLIVQRLGAIEGKLDTNNDMTTEIRVNVATQAEILKAQHEQLVEHIRRTRNLEERIKPIESHVLRIDGALKLITWFAVFCGIAASIVKVFGDS